MLFAHHRLTPFSLVATSNQEAYSFTDPKTNPADWRVHDLAAGGMITTE
jgi:hypothetical protein